MSWRAPTEDDLLGSISNAELTAYRAAVISDDQTDPATKKLAATVVYVRGFIAANKINTLGTAGTLPDALIGPAMDYLAIDIIKRIPGRKVSEERSDARKAAIKLFEQVAANKFAIEEPETAGTESISSPSPVSSEPTRYFTNTQQDGV